MVLVGGDSLGTIDRYGTTASPISWAVQGSSHLSIRNHFYGSQWIVNLTIKISIPYINLTNGFVIHV